MTDFSQFEFFPLGLNLGPTLWAMANQQMFVHPVNYDKKEDGHQVDLY